MKLNLVGTTIRYRGYLTSNKHLQYLPNYQWFGAYIQHIVY
jgi:hypothetical protein